MKGQTESSFQWLFALLAGVAIIAMLLFFIRGCATSGQQRIEGIGVTLTAQRLSSDAWQGATLENFTATSADISCPTGESLALATPTQIATIDRAPVFLPLHIGGPLHVATVPIAIAGATTIPLGGALYGFDDGTHYVVVQDAAGANRKLFSGMPTDRVHFLSPSQVGDENAVANGIPSNAANVIIVFSADDAAISRINISGISPSSVVSGVAFTPVTADSGFVSFSHPVAGTLSETSRAKYFGMEMQRGAAVSGDGDLYACGKRGIAWRMRQLTSIYRMRINALEPTVASAQCVTLLQRSLAQLAAIDTKESDDDYLLALFAGRQQLSSLQEALRAASCPVIG